jgi:hypothetical protein
MTSLKDEITFAMEWNADGGDVCIPVDRAVSVALDFIEHEVKKAQSGYANSQLLDVASHIMAGPNVFDANWNSAMRAKKAVDLAKELIKRVKADNDVG